MSGQAEMDAAKVLEQCISGEVTEANALPQLLHLHRSNSKAVVAALSEKANAVVQQADAGAAATRAGSFLITVATFLDRENFKAAAADPRPSGNSKGAQKSKVSAPVEEVCRPLLDHILLLSGGKNRAAKDKVVRAQGCNLVAALAAAVPEHRSAEEKLVEFALDKVPSIREKAVRGLSGLLAGRSPSAEMALIARTRDQNTAVRASAVRGLRVSSSTAATLLERIDDIEACVRAQLFMRLADQPTTIEEFGPAAVARLVAGLVDRSSSVRGAAGQAVDAWTQHLGGSLNLLSRCDVTSDEALGEAAAAALAARFPEEGARVARLWLGQVTGKANAGTLPDGPAPVLLARLALASMGDEARDEVLDVPSLLQRTHAALEAASNPTSSPWQEYLLRQLLNVVALVDMCDEGLRRQVERLGEAVLFQAPPQKAAVAEVGTPAATSRMAQSAIDLGIVILRKCNGLARFQAQSAKHQAVESRCSTRIVLLVSEICKPFETAAADDDGEGDQSFTTRLSLQIQELNQATETRQQTKDNIASAMKKALKSEDYIQAQKLKEQSRKNEKELEGLISERSRLSEQRDGVCMRVLAIVTALLRWSNSDLRKDPALLGTLDQILLPLVSLPALSKEVEVAVVYSICLFCVRDGGVARSHWSLLLTLLRGLQAVEGQAKSSPEGAARVLCDTARAAVAARALADCARLHGGVLDRDEVLSAATALAAVPFSSRQVVLEPLCGWLLSLGHIFFEEHLKEPVLEVQWALGWMLVEAFKQRRRPVEKEAEGGLRQREEAGRKRGLSWVRRPDDEGKPKVVDMDESDEEVGGSMEESGDANEAMAVSSRLTQFFNLLPKLPGKHGAPMLSLAVESICESGLWRRGALLPHTVDGQTRWLRGFSFPELFAFVHERLPVEMRFRLWRCSLQICVSSPVLAQLAEIPFALAAAAADAPPGAAELLQEALELGADPDAFARLSSMLPAVPEQGGKKKPVALGVSGLSLSQPKLLLTPAAAEAAESERRAELTALGINVDVWAPADVEVPRGMAPLHHRMRAAPRKPRGPRRGADAENMETLVPMPAPNAIPEAEAKKSKGEPAKPKALKPAEPEEVAEPASKKTRRVGKQAS